MSWRARARPQQRSRPGRRGEQRYEDGRSEAQGILPGARTYSRVTTDPQSGDAPSRVECDEIPLSGARVRGMSSHSTSGVGGRAALGAAVAGRGVELDLAQPDRRRGHLDALVLAAELQRLFE